MSPPQLPPLKETDLYFEPVQAMVSNLTDSRALNERVCSMLFREYPAQVHKGVHFMKRRKLITFDSTAQDLCVCFGSLIVRAKR